MSVEAALLREYWQILTNDADFQREWQALFEQLSDYGILAQSVWLSPASQERYTECVHGIDDFAARWKLPAPLRDAVEGLLRRGEADLDAALISLSRQAWVPTATAPIPSLPTPNPLGETRAEYLQRVERMVELERMDEATFVENHRASFRQEPSDAVLAWFRNRPRLWQEFLSRHYAPEYAQLSELLRLAQKYYEQCAREAQAQGETLWRSRNRARNLHYLRRVALQVYLRVVKGWTWGQIAARVKETPMTVWHSTHSGARLLGIAFEEPPESI